MEWDKLPLTVLKFGGSSVADSARMRNVAQIVKKTREEGYRVAVVVSAMGNTTDDLLALASDVASEADGREMDQLLATGEQQSVALLALALKQFGLPAQSFTAKTAFEPSLHFNTLPQRFSCPLNPATLFLSIMLAL